MSTSINSSIYHSIQRQEHLKFILQCNILKFQVNANSYREIRGLPKEPKNFVELNQLQLITKYPILLLERYAPMLWYIVCFNLIDSREWITMKPSVQLSKLYQRIWRLAIGLINTLDSVDELLKEIKTCILSFL